MSHDNLHDADFTSEPDYSTLPDDIDPTEIPPAPHRTNGRRKIEDYWEAKRLAIFLNDELLGDGDE